MRFEAIVTDLDDTLLNEKGELSEYSLRVLRECTHRGIKVIPCSGRTRCSLYPFVQRLETGCKSIGGNGSEILSEDGDYLFHQVLQPELLRQICALLEEHHLYGQVYDENHFYYGSECAASIDYGYSSCLKGIAVGRLSEFVHKPSSKLLVINSEEANRAFYPVLLEKFAGQIEVTFSKSIFLEIIPPGISKGNALKKLMKMEELSPERVLAFGDSRNDMSMLQAVTHGVAVANARPEVKELAWRVCGPNTEDGMAHFIEEIVLNDKEVIGC